MKTNKGQIIIAILGAVSAVIASGLTAWGMASNRVATIDTKVQVIEERENNHYKSLREDNEKLREDNEKLREDTKRIEGKIDMIITNFNKDVATKK